MTLPVQTAWLFLLAIPVACVSWTVTHEEIFKEPRDFCGRVCKEGQNVFVRKFFYLFTCEYCFSHYVTAGFIAITGFKLLMPDWRGYLIAGFAIVWVANVYMSLFGLLRQSIKKEIIEIKEMTKE